jgi:hypothetical protein
VALSQFADSQYVEMAAAFATANRTKSAKTNLAESRDAMPCRRSGYHSTGTAYAFARSENGRDDHRRLMNAPRIIGTHRDERRFLSLKQIRQSAAERIRNQRHRNQRWIRRAAFHLADEFIADAGPPSEFRL